MNQITISLYSRKNKATVAKVGLSYTLMRLLGVARFKQLVGVLTYVPNTIGMTTVGDLGGRFALYRLR